MNNKIIIALDQGSSASRVLAFDETGHVIARSSKLVETIRPTAKYAEMNAEVLLHNQLEALKEVLSQLDNKKISALAISSQRSTIVFWDKETGKPLAPALSWQDGRAEVPTAVLQLGQEKIHEITGLYATPFYSAAKIRWVLQQVPAVSQAAKEGRLCIGPVASYIIWHLTNGKVFACDPTLAQRTLLFDINCLDWSEQLLKAFEIDRAYLPGVKSTCDEYGVWNYKEHSIPIHVCVGDQQAALYALQVFEGNACINYGTGAFFMRHTGSKCHFLPGLLTSIAAAHGKKIEYLLEGPVNACGTIFSWLAALGIEVKQEDIDGLCAQAKHPILFLPALGGLGAPYWDFTLSPVMANFSPQTTKADVVLGVVQGLSYLIADIIFYTEQCKIHSPQDIKVSGGFSQNQTLLQNQADILQRRLIPCVEKESTAMGAALLAAVCTGIDTTAWNTLQTSKLICPKIDQLEATKRYHSWQKFLNWCKLFKSN